MGFALEIAVRYMQSKKRAFVSVGTMFAIFGVWLGVAALTTVMSVTGGFREEFREKVLGVNAHVLVLKYSADFREYRDVMRDLGSVPGVTGIAPFVINPMMITHGEYTATGVLLKGVDPELMPSVLDLPQHVVEPPECSRQAGGDPMRCIRQLRVPGAKAPAQRRGSISEELEGLRIDGSVAPVNSSRPFSTELAEIIEKDLPDAGAPASAAQESEGDGEDQGGEDEIGAAGETSTTPEGGFRSSFGDDEEEGIELPEGISPDPCRDADPKKPLPGIIIGKSLQESLHAQVGECIHVTSPTIGFTYTRDSIRAPVKRQFRVVGVFHAGFDQYDSKLVYTDLHESQAFSDGGDSVTGVEMKVADIDAARAIKEEVDRRLGNGLYHTMDWEELNHGLFTALRIQQIMMSMVLGLIIVVAAFTVIATLIMVVLEKKKEIAVLKAMGASDFALLRAFLYQGAIIGMLGTFIGLVVGYAVCNGLLVYGFPLDPKVYFISRLPVRVRPVEFGLVGAFSVLVCLVATVWPALYAARLRPAEAFREQ